uniref:Uncharacterized protein n=1 Tax=Manihot esculenta TaxID=3983 RepID=A0A2C9W8G7_MANES
MDNDNLDMFSRLTSSLLVLIVSYLPFKEAARTSVLSKQWRNVWRETTYLEFDEKSFVNLEETDENQRIQRSFFFDFIRQFLANYPRTPIQKFSLTCSKPEGFLADIQNFVIFAISRNVKDLELDFSDPIWREEDDPKNHPAAVELPFQVYQHLGLESLKLISCNFDLSRFSNSTTLKGVSLVWVDMSLASIEILLLRFPFLESLSLKKCWNIHHVEITDYEPPFELNPSEFWSEEIWVQMCMKKSLKVINVKGFKGTPNELYILRYIIMCARKLRKVNFYVFDGDDLEEIWEKFCYLRQVPSSSKNLKTHIQLISMDT